MKKQVAPEVYKAALDAFLAAIEVDPDTAFAADVQPDGAVVKHVKWTTKENGVHSGEFWEDEVETRKGGKDEDVL